MGAALPQASNSSEVVEPQHEAGSGKQAEDGWQSANCTAEPCSPETPNLYYKNAGGHPKYGFTQYIIQHEPITPIPGGALAPIKPPKEKRTIKTLRVELPPGLTVNPLATERCTLEEFQHIEGGAHAPECEPGTIVGYEEATLVTDEPNVEIAPGVEVPEGFVIPPSEGPPFTKVPVYALVPKPGEPALNGFIIAGAKEVFLETDVAWQSDYHESFTIKMPEKAPQPEPPFSTLISRQVSFGKAGNGTYTTNPPPSSTPKNHPSRTPTRRCSKPSPTVNRTRASRPARPPCLRGRRKA